ncbi:MAG: hypothetical protein ABIQ18_38300 [Umezawaea sp.]
MNGPQHYSRAEVLSEQSYEADPEHAMYLLARAQVHATLALAAATAMSTVAEEIPGSYQPDQWADLIGWTRHGLTPDEEASEQRAAAGEPDEPPY